MMGHEHRRKIVNSNILSYLVQHVEGERDMSPSQIQAGLGLLKKVMPDMAIMEIQGDVRHFVVEAPMPAVDAATWLQDRERRMIDVTPQGATMGATSTATEDKG
jgi:hypothetical protein